MDISEIRTQLAQLQVRRGQIDAEYDAALASNDAKRVARLDAELAGFDAKERSLKRQLAKAERAVTEEIEARRIGMVHAAKALAVKSATELGPLVAALKDNLVAVGVTLHKIEALRTAIRSAVALAARE